MKLGRKKTGGKYKKSRKKKSYEIAGQKRIIKISEEKKKTTRVMGGNKKTFLLGAKFVNVKIKATTPAKADTSTKDKKVEIKNVLETPSNRFLARQNIITKGTILETELGKVRVTNRPTQQGMINGLLIE